MMTQNGSSGNGKMDGSQPMLQNPMMMGMNQMNPAAMGGYPMMPPMAMPGMMPPAGTMDPSLGQHMMPMMGM
jgi:hypothetical protein